MDCIDFNVKTIFQRRRGMIKTVAISEDVFNRLNRLSVTKDVSIAKLVDEGLDFLEKKYANYGTWDGFLEYTSPGLRFLLHNAVWNYDKGCHYITVENKGAYNLLKDYEKNLIDSLKSYYGKGYSVNIYMLENE